MIFIQKPSQNNFYFLGQGTTSLPIVQGKERAKIYIRKLNIDQSK
jgi:hypothetical protein